MKLPTNLLILATLLLAVIGPSCSTFPIPPPSKAVLAHGDTIPWKLNQVVGLHVTLIDPHTIDEFHFSEGGYVARTSGSGGKVCAPLYAWKLKRGRLFVHDAGVNGRGWEWYLVSLDSNTLTVRYANGELACYRVYPN